MTDHAMQPLMGGDLELARGLERYAYDYLSPSAETTARMKARVMREARLIFAARSDAAALHQAVVVTMDARRSAVQRRGVALLLAATLSLGVAAGALAAAQPGGPLFDARLWFEGASLPADPAERASAQMARLESRMSEVLAAAARGDEKAVGAALLAYRAISEDVLAAAIGDQALLDRIRVALARHLLVLQTVAAKVPPQAQAAIDSVIDRAIEHGNAVVDRLQARPTRPPTTQHGGSKPDGAAKPAPATTATATATEASTPRADPTRHADRSLEPTSSATDKPKGPASAKPGKSPQPSQEISKP